MLTTGENKRPKGLDTTETSLFNHPSDFHHYSVSPPDQIFMNDYDYKCQTVKFDYYRMTFDTFQSQFKDYVKTTFIYPVFSLSKCCGFQVYKDFITSKSK